MNRWMVLGGAAALSAAAPIALAQAGGPAGVIKARQANFKEIGKATKGVFDGVKAGTLTAVQAQAYGKVIADLAPQLPTWFPARSGPEAGVKTAAKAEIWAKPQDFAAKAAEFKLQSAAFYDTAKKGDLEAIKAAAPKLGAACKGCHDAYRARES